MDHIGLTHDLNLVSLYPAAKHLGLPQKIQDPSTKQDHEGHRYDIPDDTDAGWYDINGMIPWPADKVEFEPGQGFWTVGYGVVLHISVPQALKSL